MCQVNKQQLLQELSCKTLLYAYPWMLVARLLSTYDAQKCPIPELGRHTATSRTFATLTDLAIMQSNQSSERC